MVDSLLTVFALLMHILCLLILWVMIIAGCDALTCAVCHSSCLLLLISFLMFSSMMYYFSYQFEALAFGSTAMCGRTTFWFWVIAAVPFYFATWEQYVLCLQLHFLVSHCLFWLLCSVFTSFTASLLIFVDLF